MRGFWTLSVLLLSVTQAAAAQGTAADAVQAYGGAADAPAPAAWSSSNEKEPDREEEVGPESLHYIIEKTTTLYRDAEFKQPYVELRRREPVYLIRNERGRALVRTKDNARGYVPSTHVSNVWIRVVKSTRTMYVFRGTDLIKELPIDLGFNTFADKERRGGNQNKDDWRTPEGAFFVVDKNPRSQFYKAFVLNYPTAHHARKGLDAKLISESEYARIVKAEQETERPPMNTALGGMIEIHGRGTEARTNWTQGCVAVTDKVMDELWYLVHVGTPVLIED